MAYLKYKYFITYNAVQTQVYPMFEDRPEIKYENPGDQIALLKKFSGKLIFNNRTGSGSEASVITDYTYFLGIETNDKCALLELDVQQYCAGSYVSVCTAEFGVIDGDWDKDNCTFSIDPKPNGVYACLFSNRKVNIIDTPTPVTVTAYAGATGYGYGNCRTFAAALLYVAQQTCSDVNSIISDFFQINPVNVSAVCSATGMENKYRFLSVAALSDIRVPVPTDAATKELITFREIMDDLRILFNVDWYVDASNNIRIEHWSFFNASAGLDLTAAGYTNYVSGTNKYSYIRRDSPRFEEWNMFSSDQSCEIEYDNTCGNKQLNEDRATYSVKKIYTDFYRTAFEPGNLPDTTPGIFLFATHDPSGGIGRVMQGMSQNLELLIPRLVMKFHRHGRPQLSGVMTYGPTIDDNTTTNYSTIFLYSEKPQKQQVEITIPFCCDDTFDSAKYQTTALGNGVVTSAVHNLYDDTLTLSLKYKLNSDSAAIVPIDLTGLQLWLKGDTGKTISGGKVTQWDDQSGGGNHAYQAVAGSAPTSSATSVTFASSGQFMATSNSIASFPSKRGTIFIVSKMSFNGVYSNRTMLAANAGVTAEWDVSFNASFDATLGLDTLDLYSYAIADNYPIENRFRGTLGDYPLYNEKYIFCLVRDANATQRIFHNGKETGATAFQTSPMTIPNTQPASAPFFIAAYRSGVQMWEGEMYEIIVYDNDLTETERQKIERYLSIRHEINLYSAT